LIEQLLIFLFLRLLAAIHLDERALASEFVCFSGLGGPAYNLLSVRIRVQMGGFVVGSSTLFICHAILRVLLLEGGRSCEHFLLDRIFLYHTCKCCTVCLAEGVVERVRRIVYLMLHLLLLLSIMRHLI
jgi:hypothetical protein